MSDESGVYEVYVRSFPDAEERMPVSDGGGTEPVWAPDGSAIYYRNGGNVMRASLAPGEVFSVDMPEEIFRDSWVLNSGNSPRTDWDVHPDGELFVFQSAGDAGLTAGASGPPVVRLVVVVNWFEELKQRMGN